MARFDKVQPKAGGSRAPLAADYDPTLVGKPIGVGLNTSGQIVKGAGNTGIVGVLVLTKAYKAGEVVDIMFNGHIVEFGPTAGVPGTDFGNAGTAYYAKANGDIVDSATAAAGDIYVGFTVHSKRLVVNVARPVK